MDLVGYRMMKNNIYPSVCFFMLFVVTSTAFAANSIEKMHLSWTTAPGLNQFRLYYASSADMSNKQWWQECSAVTEDLNSPGSYSMDCTNIPIYSYPAYIQVGVILADQSEILSNVQEIASAPVSTPVSAPAIIDISVK